MQVVFLGVDYPDYFRGYHHPCLQVRVSKEIHTNAEVAKMLHTEVEDMAYLFSDEELEVFARFIAELRHKPEEIGLSTPSVMLFGVGEDDTEGPFAYFSLGEPQTHTFLGHQITFLD
jgi:hypothetical protein